MGTDKSTVELAGRPMISWVIDALAPAVDRLIVSGRDWPGFNRIDDPPGLVGPLAGLVSGLELGDDIVLVAADQPWLRPETALALASARGTVVPMDAGIAQVTCARYAVDIAIDPGAGALHHLVERTVGREVWSTWGEDGRSWFSVDTRADLETGQQRYGSP